MSSSLTRTIPRPIEPNNGFTITSPPSERNAATASSGPSHTTVSGTGNPAPARSAVVQSLSTVRSMVRGELTTGTPRSSSACRASTRREVGDVPRDGLEARGRHALLSGLLGVPAKVGLAIDGGRLPSGPGSELQQLAARVPDFLRMRGEQRQVFLHVVLLEGCRVL